MNIAIITGITGQDGSYLADLLLNKDYIIYGIIRRSSSFNTERIEHIYKNSNLRLRYGDLRDINSISAVFREVEDLDFNKLEVYNLGAQSHVKVSFDMPIYTGQVDALGTTNILENIRLFKKKDLVRFYQASTSELYGDVVEVPQNENTPFNPQSPYAIAKLYSYWITKNYRDAYNIFGCNGILFNHESPLRGETFVTRKITRALARISLGLQETLYLGNLDAKRDWGHAKDYVEMQWLMLQQEEPSDFCIATGVQYSVRDFVDFAWGHLGKTITWQGEGLDEKGYDSESGNLIVEVDSRYFRPTEVETLLGDPSKAKQELGWEPKITLEDMVHEMMENDINIAKRDSLIKDHGYKVPDFNE